MKVVIIGASFAGVSAALAVRKTVPLAEIYLIEKQKTIGALPGGVNLYLNNNIESIQNTGFISEADLTNQNIHLLLNAHVISMDALQHIIKYEKEGKNHLFSFDKLILATGSSQWSQKILGSQSTKVVKYKFLASALESINQLQSSQTIALIGGGQIGAETADALLKKGKEVHLFEQMDYLLFKYFDQEMIQPVQDELKKQGVVFHFGETVEKINDNELNLTIKSKNTKITCDTAVFAMNVRPDLHYLDETIQLHADQTIVVNDYLQTSQKDIFAIGDCIQVPYPLSKDSFYIPLVNNAVRAGQVVAQNLNKATTRFKGSIRTIGTQVAGYYIASTGLTESEGLFFDQPISVAYCTQRSSLDSGRAVIKGKIIFETETHRVLGAQLVSKANILEKINTLALSIQMKQTLEELYQKDYLYHPYFSSVLDITNQLGFEGLWGEGNEN